MQKLEVEYQDVRLLLEIDGDVTRLWINGILREEVNRDGAPIVRLTSTVQTDYEWHEFIEGIVSKDRDKTIATLKANNQELVSRTFNESTAT